MSYDTEPPGGQQLEQKSGRTLCQVQEQKELPDGLKDDICGRIVPAGYAGLCRYCFLATVSMLPYVCVLLTGDVFNPS